MVHKWKTVSHVCYRWSIIKEALDIIKLTSIGAMEEAVKKYNAADRIDLSGLHRYIKETATKTESRAFFSQTLPQIVRHCLDLKRRVTQPIPLLKRGDNHAITLSQGQVGKKYTENVTLTFISPICFLLRVAISVVRCTLLV